MATTIVVIGDDSVQVRDGSAQSSEKSSGPAPKKRKKSRYQAAYGRNFRSLKKKHPRWAFKTLAKKSHLMTKRQMKRK